MILPPSSRQVTWKNYEIDTPTFQLTPVEKPDMSPFLIHMTGGNQIISILKGKGNPQKTPQGYGYLQANVPQHSTGSYDAKVVCLTESPTFALDFFRYRNFKRWEADQRFGIGFDKTTLLILGARPVLYIENDLNSELIAFHRAITKQNIKLSSDEKTNKRLRQIISRLYMLAFPLLEDETKQGYMWEREWRYTDSNGLIFNHNNIRLICCPEEEETPIRKILGAVANQIQFIRTWQQYDDVTDYLVRQQWQWGIADNNTSRKAESKASILRRKIREHTNAIHSLEAYKEIVSQYKNKIEKITLEQENLKSEIAKLRSEIQKVKPTRPKP